MARSRVQLGGDSGDHLAAPVLAARDLKSLLQPGDVLAQPGSLVGRIGVGRVASVQPGPQPGKQGDSEDSKDDKSFGHGSGNSSPCYLFVCQSTIRLPAQAITISIHSPTYRDANGAISQLTPSGSSRFVVATPIMRSACHALILSALLLIAISARLVGAEAAVRPAGKILFQPQLLWSNSMTTLQGTGYLIEHGGKCFGVTAVNYLDFNAGGLGSATWLDVYSERPLATFRSSLGRPLRTTFTKPGDTVDDFLLLPCNHPPEEGTPLQLENVSRYEPGTRLWFPNKSREVEIGHEWIDGTVVEDLGYLIKVRLQDPVSFQTQSGSPVLNAETGKVIGMVHEGEEVNGKCVLTLCPSRSLTRHLGRRQPTVSLLSSIARRR